MNKLNTRAAQERRLEELSALLPVLEQQWDDQYDLDEETVKKAQETAEQQAEELRAALGQLDPEYGNFLNQLEALENDLDLDYQEFLDTQEIIEDIADGQLDYMLADPKQFHPSVQAILAQIVRQQTVLDKLYNYEDGPFMEKSRAAYKKLDTARAEFDALATELDKPSPEPITDSRRRRLAKQAAQTGELR